MTDVRPILSAETGPFERALAAGMSDDLAVRYAEIMNPQRAPAEWLTHLAAHHSVDLWFDDWPEARKREMIAQCAGLSPDYPGSPLSETKGTHAGAIRYLAFVDAEVIHRISYPARFVLGLSSPSFTPLNHPAFKASWLVKVRLAKPRNAMVLGRSAIGTWAGNFDLATSPEDGFPAAGVGQGAAGRLVDLRPIERAKKALDIARAPEAEYLISTAWRRPATFEDVMPADRVPIGGSVDRTHL